MADPQTVPGTSISISTNGAFQEAPVPEDLRLGVIVAGVTGTLDPTGAEAVYPDPSDVTRGEEYGPTGAEFTGTKGPIITASGGRATSIVSAINALLSTDALLISRLATYDFGDGEAPAVFTVDPAPENCPAPFIEVSQELGTSGTGSRAERAVNVGGTVTTWGENTPSGQELESVGWDIWRILDRGEIATEQFGEILLSAGPPQNTTDPDGYPGRIVNWSAEAHEII